MHIADLEKELALATEHVEKTLASRESITKRTAAFDRLAKAQRALAAAKGDEYAAPFDIGFVPEAAVSEPTFFETERVSLLAFSAVRQMPDWRREDADYGLVEIVHCFTSAFGTWDEELRRHPLSSKGLCGYGVYEIVNSGWKKVLCERGGLYFPGTPGPTQRHFVFTFHDSTFQCIASDLRGVTIPRPFENVLSEVKKRW